MTLLTQGVIYDNLELYEEIPEYKFAAFGPFTAGFEFTEELLCKKQNVNSCSKFAFVFNSGLTVDSGSHWVALWIDIDNEVVEYFDSLGQPIPKEIKHSIYCCIFAIKKHFAKVGDN
jgi:hypothetical protein